MRQPGRILLISLAALLLFVTLTGMSRNRSNLAALNPTPTITAVASPSPGLTPTGTPASTDSDGTNETTGIILAGAILVLIVLGGTIGATRRKS